MSPNAGVVVGSQPMSCALSLLHCCTMHMDPNKLSRSNSILNLWFYKAERSYWQFAVYILKALYLFLDSNINGHFTADVLAHIFEVILPNCSTKILIQYTVYSYTFLHPVVHRPYNCWYCFLYTGELDKISMVFCFNSNKISTVYYSPIEKKVWIMYLIFSPSLALLHRQTFLMYQSRSL